MNLESRVQRLEARLGATDAPAIIVHEDEDGVWRDLHTTERVEREDVPADVRVIVFRRYDSGPQDRATSGTERS